MANILFRADAQESIGTGDLMSLVYLSAIFKKNSWKCFFAVREDYPAVRIIRQRKLKQIILIPKDFTLDQEIRLIRESCLRHNIDCLFMELTKRPLSAYRGLGRMAKVMACVNFDGLITEGFDLVVNWCVDKNSGIYRKYGFRMTKYLLGYENFIIGNHLLPLPTTKKHLSSKGRRLLICSGGVDEFDLSASVMKALHPLYKDDEIRIIIGAGYKNRAKLKKLVQKSFSRYRIKISPKDLRQDYLWADLAVSAGGLMSSELVAAGVPALLIATQKHQQGRCRYYHSKGWSCYAGSIEKINRDKIIRGLDFIEHNREKFLNRLNNLNYRGGNEKIFKIIDSYR